MISEITICDKTLLHSRTLVNTQQFTQGEICISEYNIDSITAMSDTNTSYFPKSIFLCLVPFLTEIIKNDVTIKTIYCFGLDQHNPNQNPHDMQVINKDIEVTVNLETPEITIKELLLNCVNNMLDNSFYIDEDLPNGVTLTVVKVELLKEFREERINNIQSYKEDNCIICFETKPNILFCNCAHLVVCEECFNKLENNKCPKCRRKNEIIRKI